MAVDPSPLHTGAAIEIRLRTCIVAEQADHFLALRAGARDRTDPAAESLQQKDAAAKLGDAVNAVSTTATKIKLKLANLFTVVLHFNFFGEQLFFGPRPLSLGVYHTVFCLFGSSFRRDFGRKLAVNSGKPRSALVPVSRLYVVESR
jgi:hypothetical protein